MKKLIFMLLFIGAFVMANSFSARAQHCPIDFTPCYPDCPNNVWENNRVSVIEVPFPGSGCFLEIQWRYRNTGDCYSVVYYDIYIASVQILNPSTPCIPFFDPNNVAQVIDIATSFLLTQVAVPTLVAEGRIPNFLLNECKTKWRVIKGSCWQKLQTGITGASGCYVPCQISDCCLTRYTICLRPPIPPSTQPRYVIEDRSREAQTNPCPISNEPGVICTFICD
jgi:hypothetical protein